MAMEIPRFGAIEAFAVIVDINGFTAMVSRGKNDPMMVGLVRDVLACSVDAVERHDGAVVGFMGDALLAVIPRGQSVVDACLEIAQSQDRICEYISRCQRESPEEWKFAPGGLTLKISIEYGWIHVSVIESQFLGRQRLFVGESINYASRIAAAGVGNRCHIGPVAASMCPFNLFKLEGPFEIEGKSKDEGVYRYFRMSMDQAWSEVVR